MLSPYKADPSNHGEGATQGRALLGAAMRWQGFPLHFARENAPSSLDPAAPPNPAPASPCEDAPRAEPGPEKQGTQKAEAPKSPTPSPELL